jgi:lipopolysaccharide export system permease protein
VKIFNRYLARSFLRGWLSVNLVFAGLFSFLELAKQLGDVGEGGYHMADALLYVLLTLPGRILDLAPPSALLGGIIGLGLLARNFELLAMQTFGISIQRVGWTVVRPAVLVLLALLLGAQFLIPTLEQTAWTRRETALSDSGKILPRGGFWTRDEKRFINLRTARSDGSQIADIYTFDARGRLTGYTHAREAEIGEDGNWVLHDVQNKEISEHGSRTRKMPELVVPDLLSREQAEVLALPPQTLSLSALLGFIGALEERGQNADRYRLTLWQKLSLPVMTAAMIMLSLPFVFGPARSASLGWRIMLGGIIGVTFFFLGQVLGYVGLILQVPPVWTTLVPALAVLALGIFMARRIV